MISAPKDPSTFRNGWLLVKRRRREFLMDQVAKSTADASHAPLEGYMIVAMDDLEQSVVSSTNVKLSREAKAALVHQLLRQGLSQAKVAAILHIDRTTVYRICQRPKTIIKKRRTERGRQRLNTRQLRMLRYAIHDREPKDAFWTVAARQQRSRDDRLAFRTGRWTIGLLRALVADRYPAVLESHVGEDAFRDFVQTKLQMRFVRDRWEQIETLVDPLHNS